jgi:protein-tyrosine phosphatase
MVGQGCDATAAEFASAAGLDTSAHTARQLTSEMIQWADLILVMSQGQRSQLGKTAPEAIGKTMLLGHWIHAAGTRANNGLDIPDPYKKSRDVFEHVHKLMHQGVSLWAAKI